MTPKLFRVDPRPAYRLWLQYDDGTEGEVDVSHLAGRGVFQAWENEDFFQGVELGPDGEVAWGDAVDLCADALYLRLTALGPRPVDATVARRRAPSVNAA